MNLLVYHQEREDSGDRYWYGIVDMDSGKDTGPIFCEYDIAVDRANSMKQTESNRRFGQPNYGHTYEHDIKI